MPPRTQLRADGYAPIADYGVIGDGRTAALVARDGSIDWLCLPNVDSPSVFGRILDTDRGGSFTLEPLGPYDVERRYLEASNVLETTFRTDSGVVRVTDAMLLTDLRKLAPLREVVRRVEGLAGDVDLEWRVEPRFDYGRAAARWERRPTGRTVAQTGADAVAICAWDAGEIEIADGTVGARFRIRAGDRALIDLTATHQEPLVFPGRDDAEERLERTLRFWPQWISQMRYAGRWRRHVERSALVLKLLVFAPSGAIVAAPTTSLPERIGGERNWDYRYTWIRDASFTIDALLRLGFDEEAHAFLWWVMHATRLTQPELHVLYDVSGGRHAGERVLSHLDGYRRSPPVRIGNGAIDQRQLDVYGGFMHMFWVYCRHRERRRLDADTGKELARVADHVAAIWRERDSGIWEVRSEPTHFTQSKAMCWVALQRAVELAEQGAIPDRHVERWREAAAEVRAFVDDRCWDERLQSYARSTELGEVDASLLTLPILDWAAPDDERVAATVEAVRRELSDGPLVYRYRGADGLEGTEGTFLTCSFWLADALARTGRLDEAAALMDELVDLSNDLALYPEEVEAGTGAFLGNFPQALSHLALINAAVSIEEASS